MGKIVKVPVVLPAKLGARKVRKRKWQKLEEMGQLNLFDQLKIVSFQQTGNFFYEALNLDEHDDPRAEEYYLKAIDQNQSTADAYCNLGVLMWQKQELAKAINYLTSSLKEEPRHYEAHYNLANVYSETGSHDLAKIHFEVAIEIEPGFPDSYYNLGLVFMSLKRYKEAIPYINKYIELSPESDHSTAHNLLKTLGAIGE